MSFAGIYGNSTVEEAHGVLDACAEAGVSHIDTAAAYGDGLSEEIIGAWLKDRPGARQATTIATKAAFAKDSQPNKRKISNAPDFMEEMLDRSLRLLGIEAVDLFYAHRLEQERPVEEIAGEMGELVKKGKAKAILREHRAIVDATAARDPDRAEQAVREHLKGTVSATEEIRSHFPEYFG